MIASLHHADSFATLRRLAEGDCDVIITDPPYPEAVQGNLCSGSLVGKKSVPKYELDFDPLTQDQLSWIIDATRVAKRWVVSFCSVESFGHMQALAGPEYVRSGLWYKPNSMGQLTADRPATAYEGVAFLHNQRTKKRWNGHGSYGIWRCNSTRGKKGRHPNEKPLELCLKLVALFSERGEVVLDLFCGSGAIGQACVMLGRSYIGIDRDSTWVERARVRLADGFVPMTDAEALALCTMPKVAEQAMEAL